MATETYIAARKRLLDEFKAQGYETKPTLIRPQVVLPFGTLYFHAQAVYLDNHSLWVDIRGMRFLELLSKAERQSKF